VTTRNLGESLGYRRGGGFWRNFGNIAQSIATAGLSGGIGSGQLYNFHTGRFGSVNPTWNPTNIPMPGNLGQGSQGFQFGRNRGYGSATGPGPGIVNYPQWSGQQPQGVPYPQFTDWGASQAGPPSDPNYDQIYQGPPESQAGQPSNQNRRIRAAQPLTREQQLSQLEGARALANINMSARQAREMMERMFGGKER
jgi:hypothetical protein